MNEESSRSHAVFSIYIENEQKIDKKVKTKKSVFHLIDLAGSERLGQSGAVGERLKEACDINKSLMILRNVINLASDNEIKSTTNNEPKAIKHIPYRDSKLTFLLKDALGGNSKVKIFSY